MGLGDGGCVCSGLSGQGILTKQIPLVLGKFSVPKRSNSLCRLARSTSEPSLGARYKAKCPLPAEGLLHWLDLKSS